MSHIARIRLTSKKYPALINSLSTNLFLRIIPLTAKYSVNALLASLKLFKQFSCRKVFDKQTTPAFRQGLLRPLDLFRSLLRIDTIIYEAANPCFDSLVGSAFAAIRPAHPVRLLDAQAFIALGAKFRFQYDHAALISDWISKSKPHTGRIRNEAQGGMARTRSEIIICLNKNKTKSRNTQSISPMPRFRPFPSTKGPVKP